MKTDTILKCGIFLSLSLILLLSFLFVTTDALAATSSSDIQKKPAGDVGLYNPGHVPGSRFYLKRVNGDGYVNEMDFSLSSRLDYIDLEGIRTPLAGDWDGDGIDTMGLYDPKMATFYLGNANEENSCTDIKFVYGAKKAGWIPLAGDWDGDGIDTIGLYDPKTSTFFLKNSNAGGTADITFVYGPAGAGWIPLAGCWNDNGTSTVGLYDPQNFVFYLRYSNTSGDADLTFQYGFNKDQVPIAGYWSKPSYEVPSEYSLHINSDAAATPCQTVKLTLGYGEEPTRIKLSNDNVNWPNQTYFFYTSPITWNLTSGDGVKTVYAMAKDQKGHWVSCSAKIILDTTPPTGTIKINGGSGNTDSQKLVLNLSAFDAGSGVSQMRFSFDGDSQMPEAYAGIRSVRFVAGVQHTICVQFKDAAGNWSQVYSASIKIVPDTTPPTGTIKINGGSGSTTSRDVVLTLSAADTNGIGDKGMALSNDGSSWSYQAYAGTQSWKLSEGAGRKIVYVKFKDASGNWSQVYSASITFTGNPPVAPSRLRITGKKLAWEDNSNDETEFRIYRKAGAAGTYIQIAAVPRNVTHYKDEGYGDTNGTDTTCYYKVCAYNNAGESQYSNEVSAKKRLRPIAPSNLVGIPGPSCNILRWKDNSNNETGFVLERSRDNKNFQEINQACANVTSFYDYGVNRNRKQYYRVRAISETGYSEYSNVIMVSSSR
ncbi:MAG: hypothetical protein WC522_08985 [Candidatus Omnitrophota bacterium]